MNPPDSWNQSLEVLGKIFNRFYYEGGKESQIYSLDEIRRLAFGFPGEDALIFFYDRLRDWHLKGYIKLNTSDPDRLIEVVNPNFPFV